MVGQFPGIVLKWTTLNITRTQSLTGPVDGWYTHHYRSHTYHAWYTRHAHMCTEPRIVHSGEHWAFLRRRKREREGSRHSAPKPYPDPSAPAAFDGAKVVTFIPGRLEPITSVLLRDGLVPVSDPSSRVTRIPHTIRPKKPVSVPKYHGKTWAEHDEELLARFALSKSRRNAGKSSNRAESSFQRQQEEEAHYGRVLAQKELEEIVAPRRIS
ncbi:hypothetical protein B0H14DRAFT_2559407 [Mycena olivaceomarginata]|nr:hypothetical protein B0H14DRAFT_2559407 [Mycena olivaceomarginata]